jgi:MFS family permease
VHLALRLFLPFAAGYFLSYLLRNVNAVIAPELTRELHASASDLGLLTAAYLLAFGSFQLPLGVLLDRYGPRRVEATLLVIAAAGSAWFAFGSSLAELTAARALIGLGVSACLMASFKAFAVWYPVERLPSLNAAVMVAGGLGALAATTPLALALTLFGWRELFLGLAALAVVAALGILSTPDKRVAAAGGALGKQVVELGGILRSRTFWRYAPMSGAALGGFFALQGLWAVPWLMQVKGFTRDMAAFHVLLTTVAMLTGFLAVAAFVGPLRRRGVLPDRILAVGQTIGLGAMAALWLGFGPTAPAMFVLGLAFAVGNVAYAELTARFAPALAGRVNAALNLAVFIGAFAVQWGYGALLDALQRAGWTPADSHAAAFGGLIALQSAGFLWFLLSRPRAPAGASASAAGSAAS